MPLEDILSAIKEKARHTSEEIVRSAEAKAEERLKAAEGEGRGIAGSVLAEARAKGSAQEVIARSRAESQARQTVLKEKQGLIASVFDAALAALRDIPAPEYREILLKAIVDNAEGGEEVVLGPEDEERAGKDFASVVNRALEEAGKPEIAGVVFSATSLGGGLLLRKGGVLANITFPAALKKTRDELEIEVASLLFGRGE